MTENLTVDPATGQPPVSEGGDSTLPETVPKADFDALKQRLDSFESGYRAGGQQVQRPAPTQQGPTYTDQVRDIEAQVSKLDDAIDTAVADGKPVSKLMKERDRLNQQATRLMIKNEDIDPVMNLGIQTIDQLSETVTKGNMPYLSLVQRDFDEALASLSPEHRMNPQMRKTAYDMAVGRNWDKILEAEKEKILREAAPPQDGNVPGQNSRTNGSGDEGTPKPSEVLSSGSIAAIEATGRSVDDHFKRRGYKGGWSEYYEKRLKPKEEE